MYTDLALFINGRFEHLGSRHSQPVLNPATGRTLGYLPHADTTDLDHALSSSQVAFLAWRSTPAFERSRILKRAADLIRSRSGFISRVLTMEQGKPLAEASIEIAAAADVIEWYAEEGRRAYGRIVPARQAQVRHMVIPEPVGPCAAFTPWNFPALTPARKIGGALAAGCSTILKPAEETPGTAIAMAHAFSDAGLPPGVLNLVFGNPDHISRHLIASPIVRKVSFTGSVGVGKQLMHLAADDMKRTTMELGGHAPVLVFEDADIAQAAKLAAAGKFRNAGQVCVSPTRFYVQEKAYKSFVTAFVDAAKALNVGNGLDAGVTMGPLANPRRLDAMDRLVSDARNRGARIECGGARRVNEGFFFDPTVITDIADDSVLMTQEPFGPVAPIVPFATVDEALRRANRLPFGLAAYAFTTSLSTAATVSDGLAAGMVGINTLAIAHPETPFGGIKDSGHGQEGGIEGLQAYFNVKFIAQMHTAP